MTDITSMWRSMSALAAVELLFSQNGEAKALKIARLEREKARRARCRKRFDFWTAVSHEMELAARGEPGSDQAKTK